MCLPAHRNTLPNLKSINPAHTALPDVWRGARLVAVECALLHAAAVGFEAEGGEAWGYVCCDGGLVWVLVRRVLERMNGGSKGRRGWGWRKGDGLTARVVPNVALAEGGAAAVGFGEHFGDEGGC
jgi:hypothetical protein